ncbi:MAG TPA: ATP-binding cassette domain-containing protein [Nitrososphaeria archaeon]|nr:ATP-binding cassette domain-containing protein [Nitrososphaeria archaeon]
MVRLRISLTEEEKRGLLRIRVNKSFKAGSRITKRTLEVSKAFGIGVDEEKVFPVFRDFELDIEPGDVVYVTGESGSGKSVLLRALARELSRHKEFGGAIASWELEVRPGEILVHGVGRDASEAMKILSRVGLNEAYLFLRRYRELSEGQKYRYKLAKAFWSGKKTLIFDEFCSTLDRVTARIVAYLAQKFCRRNGRTLIAATSHEDLAYDLNPDLIVRKSFGPYVEVARLKPSPRPCSILERIRIESGGYQDYKILAPFHYIGRSAGYVRKIFRAVAQLDGRRELAGVIVYSHPYLDVSARSAAIQGLRDLRRILNRRAYAKLIDESFSRISRVIVHPKYRGIGVGTMLVRETLGKAGTAYVEALAVMARYNPFFEKAGMRRIEYESRSMEVIEKTLERLELLGVDPSLINSKTYLRRALAGMSRRRLREVADAVRRIAQAKLMSPKIIEGIERLEIDSMADALSRVRAKPEYFLWRNPELASPIERALKKRK